jgi:hypothetical protein
MAKGKEFTLYSLNVGQKFNTLNTIISASELLHKICLSEKDTANAYKYHIILTDAKDSLNSLQSHKELFKLEFQYNQDKKNKEQKIKKLTNYFILGIIILALLSGLIITLLFHSRQKIKMQNIVLEKKHIESNLQFKSKELSINLMSLLKKNELIAEITHKLNDIENSSSRIDLKESVKKLNHEIKQNLDDKLWQEFSIQFKESNSEFYDKLLGKYPLLTQSELKLCAYLRLNMTSKEISSLTGQSLEALERARYRLRKKFDLTNSNSNLVSFLIQI